MILPRYAAFLEYNYLYCFTRLTYRVLSAVPEALRIKHVERSRSVHRGNITLPMGIVNGFFS